MASGGARGPVPGATHLATKVELTVSCENLMDMDIFSKSDPLCALYINTSGSHWYEFGRTEMILNCLNPKFAKKFVIDYYFEMVQRLKFCVYDIDNNTYDLSDDDFLGELECTLGQIVSNRQMTRPLMLTNKRPAGHGTITVCAEEITDTRAANLEVSARNLDKKYFWWSDPFLEFYKQTEAGWQLAHRTEVVKNNLNPIWRPFRISLRALCGGDVDTVIKVDCYDHHVNGSHALIGSFKASLAEMQMGTHMSPAEFECINPKKVKKKNYKNSGVICIKQCQIVKEFTFLDYIMGGCQINFTIAIDFTGSNGDPSSPQSLHYINPEGYNEYLTAIWAVGNVIQDYDRFAMAFSANGLVLLTTELFQSGDPCGTTQGSKAEPSCNLECNNLTADDYKDLLWITLSEFPGLLVFLLIIDRIGRRKSIAISFFMFSLFISTLYVCIGRVAITIILFTARAFISGGFQVVCVYTPEVFPTESRALAIGICSAISRLGSLITSFVAEVILRKSLSLTLFLYCGCSLLAGVASLILPIETSGRSLREVSLNQKAGVQRITTNKSYGTIVSYEEG